MARVVYSTIAMSEAVEEKSASVAEARAGVQFGGGGHLARLILSDAHGRAPLNFTGPVRSLDPALENPRWASEDVAHCHGDTAEMVVDAKFAEGAQVIFSVEVFHGGSWSPSREVKGTVQGGTARASVPMQHPAASDQNAEQTPAQVRFSVRFGGEKP